MVLLYNCLIIKLNVAVILYAVLLVIAVLTVGNTVQENFGILSDLNALASISRGIQAV